MTCDQPAAQREVGDEGRTGAGGTVDIGVTLRGGILPMFISFLLITTAVVSGIGWMSDTVEARSDYQPSEVEKPTVVDRTDEDGDGYLSSFTVRWEADTFIVESTRGKRDMALGESRRIESGFAAPGNPKFGLFGIVEHQNRWKQLLLGVKEVNRREPKTVEMEVSLLDKKFRRKPQGNTLAKQKGMEGLALTFVESDSSPNVLVLKNIDCIKAAVEGTFAAGKAVGGVVLVAVGAATGGAGADTGIRLIESSKSGFVTAGRSIKKEWNSDDYILTRTKALSQPIRLEQPSEDATKQVEVTSNVNGATVEVNGKEVGTTPWTGTYPVDYSERNGPATVEVSADGYVSDAKSVEIDGEGRRSVDFDLDKNTKPLVVNATPSNSSVYIDGSYVGQPPVKQEMWVEESVDIWVNNSGYTNKRFEDISPPRTIDWDFTASSSSGSGYGGSFSSIGYIGNLYISDFQTYDYLEPELNLEGIYWANFSHAPDTVRAGDTVSFDGTLSTSIGGNITKYEWSFGDGTTATGPRPSHTYGSSGRYTVNLTITTQFGNTSSTEETIEVKNSPPTAGFIPSANSVVKGDTVTFDASTSSDPESSIVRYEWDLDGDGSSEATGQTTTNAYASSGSYTVELTVTDDAGQSATAARTVEVKIPNAAPQPRIDISAQTVSTGDTVTFDASATSDPDGSVRTYNWELGDGTQTNGETVSHSYNASGTYRVSLLVADDRGKIASTTETVTVGSGGGQQTQRQTEGEDTSSESGGDDNKNGTEGRSGDENATEEGGAEGMPGFGPVAVLVAAAVYLAARVHGRRD